MVKAEAKLRNGTKRRKKPDDSKIDGGSQGIAGEASSSWIYTEAGIEWEKREGGQNR